MHDVEHADVASLRISIAAYLCEIGKAQNIEPVIDRHDDDISAFRQARTVVTRRRS
jgi:hypothetical protein